ncbi:DUF2585 family protein [Sphingomonas mesophila]|uniref:DUF2585 family protein n=1 Tax=Sphingomonas mesophila TaxID=2303576 RepID=UPI000E5694B3|nr:DUF2585 family protein [Sphingomonas mesophila]
MGQRAWIAASIALVIGAAAALMAMGRPWLCACGHLDLWGQVGPEQSQMLADWYSPSHVIHGILFYAIAWKLWPRWSRGARFVAALAVEIGWELVENTPLIIDRYREATMALGYTGDSIVNSMSDVAMMALGFVAARFAPLWVSVVAVIALELTALVAVRDNLTLNVLMLVAPVEAVAEWQTRA